MRPRIAMAVIVLAVVGVAGCGSSSDRAQRVALAALGTETPSPRPSPPAAVVKSCGDPTASLRPPATLPAPGAMPPSSFMAAIKQRGHLVAGVDQNTLLFAYFNPLHGGIEGFEIDLVHQLAKAIFGNPGAVVFKAITTAERISAVQSGRVDVVADAMTITCTRRRQVAFSTVYYDAGQKLLVPANSAARGVSDLAGKKVCATKGSTSLDTLQALPPPRPVPYVVAQRTDCLVSLQQGLVDAVTSDDSILLGFNAQDPYTKIVGPRFAGEPYGMAISPAHADFVRFTNGVLARMRADGTWRSIFVHWLGRLVPTPPPPPAHYSG